MLRSLSTLTLAASLLVGCNSPTTATRLGAKTATLIGLNETEASAGEAAAIVTIAIMVKGATGDGFDPDMLHETILEAIIDQFDGQQQIIYVAIVDELLLLVLEEIATADVPIDLGEAGIYVNAAAVGVKQGAELYILLIQDE